MSLQPATPATSAPAEQLTPAPGLETNGQAAEGKALHGLNGSRSPSPSRLPQARRQNRLLRLLLLGGLAVLLLGAAGGAWYLLAGANTARTDLVTHRVGYEKLRLTIVERGALESAENSDIVCRVKAGARGSTTASTIKWVIEDGSQVTRGQLVVELDDSGLQEQLKSQKIVCEQANAAWVAAQENYLIVDSQNLSDIETAKILVDLAELDLEKYLKGDYEQLKKDILGRISIAESDREMWLDRTAWSDRMVQRGYISSSQAQAERSRLENAKIALAKVQEELRVLEDYTYRRTKQDLEGKVAEAQRALDRVIKQAKSKSVQALTDRNAKKSIYEQEKVKAEEYEEEIRKCMIESPQDGMVVYYMNEQSRYDRGSQQSIVAQGEPVREGQKLMRIPDLSKMVVNVKVHEALVSRVRGEESKPTGFGRAVRATLCVTPDAVSRLFASHAFAVLREKFKDKDYQLQYGGQRARIRVEAFPERILQGHVKSVATIASQSDWMSSDVKVYQTVVAIDEPVENLKPGMSAEVTILAGDSNEEVLTIPVQAIIGSASMGRQRKCFVLTPDGAQERDIVVGMSNEKMAEIKSGLYEGDEVVLNPRALVSEQDKVRVPSSDSGEFGKGGEGKAKGKGKAKGAKGGDGGIPGRGPEGGNAEGFPGGGPGAGKGNWPGKNE